MKRTLRKYSFKNEGAANAAILSLGVDEEGGATHGHTIMKIGHIVETPAVLDEDGEVVTEAVLSDTYAVDAIWNGEPNKDWDQFMIWVAPFGILVSGGIETRSEYINTCKALHPELFPEPSEEDFI